MEVIWADPMMTTVSECYISVSEIAGGTFGLEFGWRPLQRRSIVRLIMEFQILKGKFRIFQISQITQLFTDSREVRLA